MQKVQLQEVGTLTSLVTSYPSRCSNWWLSSTTSSSSPSTVRQQTWTDASLCQNLHNCTTQVHCWWLFFVEIQVNYNFLSDPDIQITGSNSKWMYSRKLQSLQNLKLGPKDKNITEKHHITLVLSSQINKG